MATITVLLWPFSHIQMILILRLPHNISPSYKDAINSVSHDLPVADEFKDIQTIYTQAYFRD